MGNKKKCVRGRHPGLPSINKSYNGSDTGQHITIDISQPRKVSNVKSQPNFLSQNYNDSSLLTSKRFKETDINAISELQNLVRSTNNVNNNLIYPSLCDNSFVKQEIDESFNTRNKINSTLSQFEFKKSKEYGRIANNLQQVKKLGSYDVTVTKYKPKNLIKS